MYITLGLLQKKHINFEEFLNELRLCKMVENVPDLSSFDFESLVIVHGIVQGRTCQSDKTTHQMNHAWMEFEDFVIEMSGGNKFIFEKELYYTRHEASFNRSFDLKEITEIISMGKRTGVWTEWEKLPSILSQVGEDFMCVDFYDRYISEGDTPEPQVA
jgi:hypothetical protein